jgi:DNA helicase-2/ATP-dependent DNA helicase PcrA
MINQSPKMNNTDSLQKSDIFNGLNKQQNIAVEALNGPLLIIAGAGSGKTKVLTHRIANLIANGTAPHNILALTFTNKAAKELKERISNLIGFNKARYIWAGTFHSVFARILRSEAESIGFTPSFSIYDTDDSTSQIRQIIKSLNYSEKNINAANVRNKISSLKNKLTLAKEFESKAETIEEKYIAKIYRQYEYNLKSNNAMDFDDLLINIITLLRQSKETLEKYQKLFKYILIDEYQDTNRAQYISIQLLAKAHQNICVVGDDAQSIYRWRGADISNILNFNGDYPYAKVVRLEQNYRSTKTIIEAAHHIILNNQHQIPKTLWTENVAGEKIVIHQCADDREEAFKIASIIQTEISNGLKYNEIAVLYRTNAQSLSLENTLRMMKIPYNIIGGTSFYKRKEIKDVLAYLTLLVNPLDSEAFKRAVNEPPRGIGLTSLRNIQLYADFNNTTLLDACAKIDRIPEVKGKAASSAYQFYEMITNFKNQISDTITGDLISDFISATGIIEMYKDIGSEDSNDRLRNIQQLLVDIEIFFNENESATLDSYLQQISLVTDVDDKDLNENKTALMTLHTAKGLEFPAVIISGVEKGLFPLERTRLVQEEEEEERRLFYVGVTRAMRRLYVTYALRRAKFGEISNQGPSKFISEIPNEFTNRAFSTGVALNTTTASQSFPKKKPTAPRDEYSQISPDDNYSQLPSSTVTFRVGDKVRHINFGRGKIIQLTGAGNQLKAIVNFDGVGNKVLMMNYAKLDKI